jgi:hypothetical protein
LARAARDFVLFIYLNFTPFSPQFRGIQLFSSYYLVSSLQLPYGSGETNVESHASSVTQPNQAALLLNTARIQPGSQLYQCVGGNTVHLATWLARTAPGPPQESLGRDETRISLPAKPSLTRATLGQLCVASRTSRSRPVTTEPGREPRVSVALNHCTTREAPGTLVLTGFAIGLSYI